MNNSKSIVDQPNFYPPWAPRIWTGMRVTDYWNLLAQNKFRIHPSRYPMTLLVAFWSLLNSGLSSVQWLLKHSAIAQAQIEKPPIFVIGHWRCGTTLTHELMSLDMNFAFPSNYDAFVPYHFLISSWFIKPPIKLLLPKQRPFDDMSIDLDYPQEDDFALMAMGAKSYYQRLGFPNLQEDFMDLLEWDKIEANEKAKLADSMRYFVHALTLHYGRQLVLKSPPHTGRIKMLCELFPTAKFVHISRHPYNVVPSTMRLWAISDDIHGFQKANHTDESLMAHVARAKTKLYSAYHRDCRLLAENQLVEVSFEQLTANPAQTMTHIYRQLELEGKNEIVASTNKYFEQRKHHKKNKHQIDAMRDQIDSDWADYMKTFGYEKNSNSKQESVA